MRLSVIIPTVGRGSLDRAIRSADGADEIVVVVDLAVADEATVIDIAEMYGDDIVLTTAKGGDHGYTARTVGMGLATGTHLAFLDDDDAYTQDAISLFRQHAAGVPVIFRMQHPEHGVLWRVPHLAFGNVGTPMFLVPNEPDKLGVWKEHVPGIPEPGGDYTFIHGCVEKMGAAIWHREIVAKVRPGRTVSVVTPWLNHVELFPDYAAAVQMADEVIVVDDGSDPELDFAKIRAQETVGYARASNAGLYAATCEVVLFLNNDVVARRSDWLPKLVAAVEPGLLVGAKLRHDLHGDVDGQRYPYLDGWCLAGMREDLLRLEGFDEGYMEPAYYSDNDLCLRARLAGMSLREVKVGLDHLIGATTGAPDEPRKLLATEANFERFAERVREMVA